MSIETALGALVGGIVGLSSAVLLDKMRWTRDDRLKRAEIRRNTYIDFLAALHDGHIELRIVAQRTSTAGTELHAALHEAVYGPRPWKLWHRVALVAPSEIVRRGKVTLELLEHLRDILATDPRLAGEQYLASLSTFFHEYKLLRNAMRSDLGLKSLEWEQHGSYSGS